MNLRHTMVCASNQNGSSMEVHGLPPLLVAPKKAGGVNVPCYGAGAHHVKLSAWAFYPTANYFCFCRYGRSKWDKTHIFSSSKLKEKTFRMNKLKVAEDDGDSSVVFSAGETSKSLPADRKAQVKAAKEKSQATAIVTGVIAILLGVGYLVVVQFLDTRGVILVPPPPEALEP